MLVCLDFLLLVSMQRFRYHVTILRGAIFFSLVVNWNFGILQCFAALLDSIVWVIGSPSDFFLSGSLGPAELVHRSTQIYDQSSQDNNELNNAPEFDGWKINYWFYFMTLGKGETRYLHVRFPAGGQFRHAWLWASICYTKLVCFLQHKRICTSNTTIACGFFTVSAVLWAFSFFATFPACRW